MIKPIQRIQKYHLLVKKVLTYSEQAGAPPNVIESLRDAVQCTSIIPKRANDMMDAGHVHGFTVSWLHIPIKIDDIGSNLSLLKYATFDFRKSEHKKWSLFDSFHLIKLERSSPSKLSYLKSLALFVAVQNFYDLTVESFAEYLTFDVQSALID